jgi:two-component system, chemotaxis family, protein-glutamate methylesterase/glutaminase
LNNGQDGKNPGAGFAGTLKNIQLADLIQICCLSAVSLGIQVTKDDQQGMIYIDAGSIVHAETQSLKGEEAFLAIMGWQSGGFETIAEDRTIERTIQQGYQYLLMEAAHQADERDSQAGEGAETPVASDDVLQVLVVEDSPIMSKILISMLNADEHIQVAGTAKNGEEALDQLDALKPDIISMDVNMPVMNGSTALKHIMIKNPCPVVIMSNLGSAAHQTIIDFLNLGAVDFMSKPIKSGNILVQQQKIVERVHRAATARIERFQRIRTQPLTGQESVAGTGGAACERLTLINAGAGGFGDLTALLGQIPADCSSAVVVLLSLPPALIHTLVAYFDPRCHLPVMSLGDDSLLKSGHCYLGTNGRAISLSTISGEPAVALPDVENSGCLAGDNHLDDILAAATDIFRERLTLAFLSGAEIGSLKGIQAVKANGGRVVVADPQHAVVADTLEILVRKDLADRVVAPTQIAALVADH